jgi:hypothetical protein
MVSSTGISTFATGSFVTGGLAFMSPGRKKLAGDTLLLALMPPQPPLQKNNGTRIASRRKFQFNLTCQV